MRLTKDNSSFYFSDIAVRNTDLYRRHEEPKISWNKALKNTSEGRILTKMLAKETNQVDTERPIANEYRPPKIHENSVFLYQSESMAKRLRKARAMEIPTVVLAYLAIPDLVFSTVTIGLFYYYVLRPRHFEPAKRLVARMDLLPHLEMIAFQKVGMYGCLHTSLVRIKDLEKFEPDWDSENFFWGNNPTLDRDLVYRDKVTGELFCFDTEGVWDWEGISHKLLF